MKAVCAHCGGTGKVEVEAPSENPPCHKCDGTKLRLEFNVGWFCVRCESGPYIIGADKLIKK